MRENWELGLVEAVARFARNAQLTKGDIARALGFSRYLSLSNLKEREAVGQQVCAALHADNLPHLAVELRLSANQYEHLEQFVKEAIYELLGWSINPRKDRESRRESLDWGMVGVELFDANSWNQAASFLESSWESLQKHQWQTDPAMLFTAIRVTTQLITFYGYQGQLQRALRLANTIKPVINQALQSSADKPLIDACAGYLTQVGVVARLSDHLGLGAGQDYSQRALSLYTHVERIPGGQVATLRDQAKPLIKQALIKEPGNRNTLIAEAWAALNRADKLAGGDHPFEELRYSWLFTRLTHAECLAVCGQADTARRCWEEIMTLTWVQDEIKTPATPLSTKNNLTEMAILAAESNFNDLNVKAQRFLLDPRLEHFQDRKRRVEAFARFADTEQKSEFYEAILR